MNAHLFGVFSLEVAGVPVINLTERQQSLLAYLLLKRHHPQPRPQIAFLFWSDSPDGQAQTNLRQLLHHLRHAWPGCGRYLSVTSKTIQWRSDIPCLLDVEQFASLLKQAANEPSPVMRCRLLEEAVNLYRGDLLPTCYEDWVLPERERLRTQFLAAQEQLIELLEGHYEFKSAIRYAEQLLQQDPLHEASYRHLMRLHALNNNRAQALRVYQTCVTVLQQELGVKPDRTTHQQYEQILNLEVSAPPQTTEATIVFSFPLLGRGREWAKFQQVWQQTASHQPHFLLLRGEAGMGKTRFLEEISQWVSLMGAITAHTRSYSAQGGLAYGPVTAWLRSNGLRPQLTTLNDLWLAEISRLLPELLVEYPHLSPPQPLTDSWQRQRFYEALAHAFLAHTHERPLVLILDDLQWSDQETLGWLSYLLHHAAASSLLLVGAIRSGTVTATHPLQPWLAELRQEQWVTEIRLRPLDETESASLARHITQADLTGEQILALYHETEGNPLFIIEMMRATLEQSEGKIIQPAPATQFLPTALPPRVQAMIEARLEQLSATALDLAERAAAIGREFSLDVLARLPHNLSDEALIRGLDELWQRRIVREQGATSYDFSHDKIRDVVYNRLSQARRRLLHRQIAEALLTIHTGDPSPVSAQIAGHYEQALMPQEASRYYQKAAELAQHIYANAEVVNLLNKALDLLKLLPANKARDTQELALRVSLAVPFVALKSYNAPEVFDHYRQVLLLCDRLGRPPDPRALRGLAIAHILQSDFPQCEDLGQKILDLAQIENDDLLLVEGHYVLGVTAFWQGKYISSRDHLEQALAHFDPKQRAIHIHKYAQDPEVVCLVRLGFTLWYLGYPELAYQKVEQAIALATAQAHPFSLEYALHLSCLLYDESQDTEQLQAKTETFLTVMDKYNLPNYMGGVATFHKGWLISLQGNYETSTSMIRQVVQSRYHNHTYLGVPHMMRRLATTYWHSGQIQPGLVVLEEALSLVQQRGEACWLAELVRLKGELLWAQNTPAAEVAFHFQNALDIAQKQEARILELRAYVSLCRLWLAVGDAGRLTETRQALQNLYDWFTEGFDTIDLQEAKAMLNQLASDVQD